ncbi:MAG: ribonucleoside-diphosphate reductase subunit alpha [Puniceicoccales bacterium]|jgi:ribonucleoside-diphosphate reductase alpha chain|nr:ribonucleoside-diphosphate reductase subunit alpha [Puniceicoccales bacterium]
MSLLSPKKTMNAKKNLELKRIIGTPIEEKPRFDWRRLVDCDGACICEYYSVGEIADKIGESLVNASLLNGQSDVCTDENKQLVVSLTRQVCAKINVCETRPPSQILVNEIIEEVLVRGGHQDIARAFVARCKFDSEYYQQLKGDRKLNLIRRDGSVVPWNTEKIRHAVEMAFVAQHQNPERVDKISRAVTQSILDEGLSFIHIENVQDRVQEELMRQGEYKVAEAYILYRAERAKLRGTSDAEGEKQAAMAEESILLIRDANGTSFFWDGSELRRRIEFANDGLDSHLTFDEIFLSLKEGITSEIDAVELKNRIVKNARRLIEKDPVLAVFAARIQLLYLYEEIFHWDCAADSFGVLAEKQAAAFVEYIKGGVAEGLLHEDMLKYDTVALSKELDISCDREFDAIALQGLCDNYFMRGLQNQVLETPQMLWMRVAMGVFLADGDADDVLSLYRLMRDGKFCLSTPTLYYAGTQKAQMMSSYVYYVSDDMRSIMTRGISDNAFIAKWGGGIAGSWSNVRGRGSRISGTRGEAPGVIPFLQLHQHQLALANQGVERRRGRGVAYLEIWHSDVIEFIDYKKKHGFIGMQKDALGTVIWVPDLFMRRLENDGDWTLFNSEDAYALHELYGEEFEKKYGEIEELVSTGKISGRRMACREIWQKIMQRIFEAGYPKIAFKDTCNRANMCKNGIIHAAGLCLEHAMNTTVDETAVCNTGALNISKHLTSDGAIDRDAMRHTVKIATRALDAMIDANFFPSDASAAFAKKYRAIGLGMMGLQNAFYQKNLPFNSPEAVEFGERCAEIISYETIGESCALAEKYGPCEMFESSEWKMGKMPCDFSSDTGRGAMDWDGLRSKVKKFGVRNAYLNAFSPTRKIAKLLGCYPELSPATKNVFVKRLDDNYEVMVISPELVKILKKSGVWNKAIHKQIRYFEGDLAAIDEIPEAIKEVFSTAYMIDNETIIDGAARRQKWIDQSQSLRLFLGSPNLKTLSDMFVLAWSKGVKGIYEVKVAGFFSGGGSDRHAAENDFAENGSAGARDSTDAMVKILERFREIGGAHK